MRSSYWSSDVCSSDLSFQHVGGRYTQPGDQENNPRTFVHGFTFGGAPIGSATTLDLKLPDYQLVNLGAGIEFPDELEISVYVNNLLDEIEIGRATSELQSLIRISYAVLCLNNNYTYRIPTHTTKNTHINDHLLK